MILLDVLFYHLDDPLSDFFLGGGCAKPSLDLSRCMSVRIRKWVTAERSFVFRQNLSTFSLNLLLAFFQIFKVRLELGVVLLMLLVPLLKLFVLCLHSLIVGGRGGQLILSGSDGVIGSVDVGLDAIKDGLFGAKLGLGLLEISLGFLGPEFRYLWWSP